MCWQQLFAGRMPGEMYYHRAMEHYQRLYNNVVFIVASDDREYIEDTFSGRPHVVLAPGNTTPLVRFFIIYFIYLFSEQNLVPPIVLKTSVMLHQCCQTFILYITDSWKHLRVIY